MESLLSLPDLPHLLCRVVEAKLKTSRTLDLVKQGKFGNNPLSLSNKNSLLLEFQGLKPNSRYRMLVSFLPIDLLDLNIQTQVGRCRDLLRFDLAVFWIPKVLDPIQVHSLKTIGVHTLASKSTVRRSRALEEIPDFIHVPDLAYDHLLEVNLLCNDLAKRLRKKFHLVLSELAAENYDDYGTFATREVMHYEDDLLKDILTGLLGGDRGKLAVDVGCGDGRHTRVLAKNFEEVIAFDISKKMLQAAREKDQDINIEGGLVTYYETDVEYEELPEEITLSSKVDFVCASFGMPSFVEDTVSILRRFYRWLRPGGQALFTFYNSKSLGLTVSTAWKDRALSATIDIVRHALEVEIREGVKFSIFCRPIDDRVFDFVKAIFTIESYSTFPHVLSILPSSTFGTDEKPQPIAREIFPKADRAVANDPSLGRGHYVFIVASKDRLPREGYLRVLRALEEAEVQYEILEHREVVTTTEVGELLSLKEQTMVKTVVLKSRKNGKFFITLVPATRRVNRAALAATLDTLESDLVLAPPAEVESVFGFPIGGIAPLGLPHSVEAFMDKELREVQEDFLYMGVGDNTKTLKLERDAFLRVTETYKTIALT